MNGPTTGENVYNVRGVGHLLDERVASGEAVTECSLGTNCLRVEGSIQARLSSDFVRDYADKASVQTNARPSAQQVEFLRVAIRLHSKNGHRCRCRQRPVETDRSKNVLQLRLEGSATR